MQKLILGTICKTAGFRYLLKCLDAKIMAVPSFLDGGDSAMFSLAAPKRSENSPNNHEGECRDWLQLEHDIAISGLVRVGAGWCSVSGWLSG